MQRARVLYRGKGMYNSGVIGMHGVVSSLVGFEQFAKILLAILEDRACHEMHLLLLEDIDHLHLLLYRQEQIIQLFLVSLGTINCLLTTHALLHHLHLQIIQGLRERVDLQLSLRQLLQHLVLIGSGSTNGLHRASLTDSISLMSFLMSWMFLLDLATSPFRPSIFLL